MLLAVAGHPVAEGALLAQFLAQEITVWNLKQLYYTKSLIRSRARFERRGATTFHKGF